MREIYSRAPSRVDFAGGTLDIPFFVEKEKGATLNCAISKYGYSLLKTSKNLEINSINYNKKIKVNFPIKYDGKLDLLKAAFKISNFNERASLTAYHEMKPHSRLGTSSSISVSALGAILKYQNKRIDKIQIAELATAIELEELGMHNGLQDQYAASLGGLLMLRYENKKTKIEKIRLKKEILYELEKNLVLCYLNSQDVAGNINYKIIKEYEKGNEKVISSIKNIKKITFDMYKALKKDKLEEFAELLNLETENRNRLSKYIVTNLCKKYINIGLSNGAIASKVLGAGAGGTLLFYAKENQKEKLIKALERNKAKVFDFRFDFEGLQIWEK